jgi:hypothetical protein
MLISLSSLFAYLGSCPVCGKIQDEDTSYQQAPNVMGFHMRHTLDLY